VLGFSQGRHMRIFNRWFRSSKRVTLPPEMREFYLNACNRIKLSVGHKLLPMCRQCYDEDFSLTLVAAVCNKLFASPSPHHSAEILRLAERAAENVLRTDNEVRYAAVMGCRAYMLCVAGVDKDKEFLIVDTIEWMQSVCALPADWADPVLIENLANTLYSKYHGKKT